jgi:methylmalonyl-CoA mutase C-terminal domain/subunit
VTKGKILIAKLGLDGHDRGARLITRILMEAGYEVLYTGLRQTPEAVVHAAMQEDVDVIGISILSGSHMTLVPQVIELLRARNMMDVPIVVGGIIPNVEELLSVGVAAVLGPGASDQEIAETIEKLVAMRRRATRFEASA